ncbi:hypothetical protein LTR84_002553 [Exophiala bonariae]|uniref:Uncharacterized protein n=1 Tax=Exophiala bonariae TaxID=1690606 RepID=A0AAV9NDG2_9EURO|nr:hypothetical protein LTR84_002553 [Exophiala bonariae]
MQSVSTTTLLHSETNLISGEVEIEHGRFSTTWDGDIEQDIVEDALDQHPLGVRPSGNALTSVENAQKCMGLFETLPDSLTLLMLEFLDQDSLVNLGGTCKSLYAYCTYDQLWRDIAVNDMTPDFSWSGSWRASRRKLPSADLAKVDCRHVFSDALHRPFLCSQIPLSPYGSQIPQRNQIVRIAELSTEEFNAGWSDKPFVLTGPVKRWPVYNDWCQEHLLSRYGDSTFRAEGVDWPLSKYLEYMNSTKDESPLYLFDQSFVETMGLTVGKSSYQPPSCFEEDLFTLLGEQRPDHRWLIVGPERSGSTFHKDPNATSAWNAVIRGSKYWIMFPSSILPPGVYMSDDQGEVTSPLSIAEWLLSFHAEARETLGCIEGVCYEGEVLHVPSGWWHLVVNLEPAIAITQNFVPRSHVGAAYRFLKYKSNQVSGFKDNILDPCSLFMERLRDADPGLAATLVAAGEKKRKWENVVEADDDGGQRGGFSFGFGDDIEDEE